MPFDVRLGPQEVTGPGFHAFLCCAGDLIIRFLSCPPAPPLYRAHSRYQELDKIRDGHMTENPIYDFET
jgi:hypothetical protein